MRIKNQSVSLLLLSLAIGGVSSASADSVAEQKAVEAAGVWLKLVDGGEYEKSWASTFLNRSRESGSRESEPSRPRRKMRESSGSPFIVE